MVFSENPYTLFRIMRPAAHRGKKSGLTNPLSLVATINHRRILGMCDARSRVMGQVFDALDPRLYGVDAAVEFPPHKVGIRPPINASLQLLDPAFAGTVIDYLGIDLVPAMIRHARRLHPKRAHFFGGHTIPGGSFR